MAELGIGIVSIEHETSSSSGSEGVEATLQVLNHLKQLQETSDGSSRTSATRHSSSSSQSQASHSTEGKYQPSVASRPEEVMKVVAPETMSQRGDVPGTKQIGAKSMSPASRSSVRPDSYPVAPLLPSNRQPLQEIAPPKKGGGLLSCCFRADEQVVTMSAENIRAAPTIPPEDNLTKSEKSQNEDKKADDEQPQLNEYERAMIDRLRELLSLETSLPTMPTHIHLLQGKTSPISLDITDSQIANTFSIDTKELQSFLLAGPSKDQADENIASPVGTATTSKKSQSQAQSQNSKHAITSQGGKSNTFSHVASDKFSGSGNKSQNASTSNTNKEVTAKSSSHSMSASARSQNSRIEPENQHQASSSRSLRSYGGSISTRGGPTSATQEENTVPRASSYTSVNGHENHSPQQHQDTIQHSNCGSQISKRTTSSIREQKFHKEQQGTISRSRTGSQRSKRSAFKHGEESHDQKQQIRLTRSSSGSQSLEGLKFMADEEEPRKEKIGPNEKPPMPEKTLLKLKQSGSILRSKNSKSSFTSQVCKSMSRSRSLSRSSSDKSKSEGKRSASGSLIEQKRSVSFSDEIEGPNRQTTSRDGADEVHMSTRIPLKASRSGRSFSSKGSSRSKQSLSRHSSQSREERDPPVGDSAWLPPRPEHLRKRKEPMDEIIAAKGGHGGYNEGEGFSAGFECIYQLDTENKMEPHHLQAVRSEQNLNRQGQIDGNSFKRAGSAAPKYGAKASLNYGELQLKGSSKSHGGPEDAILNALPSDPAVQKASSLLAQAPKDIRDDISDLGMLSPKHRNMDEKENTAQGNSDHALVEQPRTVDVLDLFTGGMFCCNADTSTSV